VRTNELDGNKFILDGRREDVVPVRFVRACVAGHIDDIDWRVFVHGREAAWMKGVRRVVLVHRLREVVAQVGFTRFEAASNDQQGELDLKVKAARLSAETEWAPATENRGEGLFIEFDEAIVEAWSGAAAVRERGRQLLAGFDLWKEDHELSSREFFGVPYVMLHSLSHLLMTAMSLECGYPASSLREEDIRVSRPVRDLDLHRLKRCGGDAWRACSSGPTGARARSASAGTRHALFERPDLCVSASRPWSSVTPCSAPPRISRSWNWKHSAHWRWHRRSPGSPPR
jgi:hypothetical protein